MGLKIQMDNLHENKLDSKTWHIPWVSTSTGGVLILTTTLLLLSIIGAVTTYTTYNIKEQELEKSRNNLEHVKDLFFLEEQYQLAFENKNSSHIGADYTKFNQPTSVSALKSYLKKWQTNLHIQSIRVNIEAARPSSRGKGIMIVPIQITAHVLTDKMLYQLLEKLQSETPGLIVIRRVDLKRSNESPHITLDQLISDKKTTLIEGTILCDWFIVGASK